MRCVVALLVAGVLATGIAAQEVPRPRTRVLVLYPEQSHLPAVVQLDSAMRQRVGEAVEIFAEHLDFSRFPRPEEREAFREHLLLRYAKSPPDLVIAVTRSSFDMIRRGEQRTWPGAPTILVLLDRDPAPPLEPGDALLRVVPGERGTVEDVLRLFPGVDSLVVVGGASPFDLRAIAAARAALDPLAGQLPMRWVTGPALPELLQELARLERGRHAVLYLSMFHDRDGRDYVPREVLGAMAAASPVPIVGIHGSYLGHGLLGGWVIDYGEAGAEVGRLLQARLSRRDRGGVDSTTRASRSTWDARGLARWGIRRSALPPGARVVFEEPSLWEQYRRWVLGALAVIGLQGLLIGALLTERRRRAHAEAEVRDRLRTAEELQRALELRRAALDESREQYRTLVGHLITAQEEEARRVAADLHDDVTQRLASAGLEAQAAAMRLPDTDATARGALLRAGEATRGIAGDLAQLARRLHPATLEAQGLTGSLRALARSASTDPVFRVEVVADAAEPPLPPATQLALYRVAQEATRNARHHGHARQVTITLARHDGRVRLAIEDDGHGFDPAAPAPGGIGLVTMRERIALAGGDVKVASRPGTGTRVLAEVPIDGGNGGSVP